MPPDRWEKHLSFVPLLLVAVACGGGAPPVARSVGEVVEIGPFGVRVTGAEGVSTTERSSGNAALGVAVFVELTLSSPDPAVAAEIAELHQKEREAMQTISDRRFTQRNFDDSELTDEVENAMERRETLEEEAYHPKPRAHLLTRGIRLVDEDGDDYRPSGYVTASTYETQMRARSGAATEPFDMLASSREEASYREGESPQEWVLLFRLPPTAGDLTVQIDNPSPARGQVRAATVALGHLSS